jgi:hypothetical protein
MSVVPLEIIPTPYCVVPESSNNKNMANARNFKAGETPSSFTFGPERV